MYRFIPVLVLCLLAGIQSADAAESLAVYSDVCINKDSGDLNGMRIAIFRLGGVPYLALQWAESDSFEEPEMEKISPDELKKGNVKFSTQYAKEPAPFSGRITEKTIIGTFDNKLLMKDYGYKIIQLRRVPASQKTYGVCY
jgi:hypothetical protein